MYELQTEKRKRKSCRRLARYEFTLNSPESATRFLLLVYLGSDTRAREGQQEVCVCVCVCVSERESVLDFVISNDQSQNWGHLSPITLSALEGLYIEGGREGGEERREERRRGGR